MEIVNQVPLDGEKAVKQPHIDALKAVEPEPALLRGESAEVSDVDVVIMAIDVGVGVMNRVVFPVPEIRTAAHQVERERHDLIDPGVVGIRPVAAIMLDVESDRRHCKSEHDSEREDEIPTGAEKYEENIGREKPRQDGRGFEIHLRTVSLGATSVLEVSINPLSQLTQETIAAVEFQLRRMLLSFRIGRFFDKN